MSRHVIAANSSHSFSLEMAQTLGLECAVLVNFLHQWSELMEADSGYWQISCGQLLKIFSFWNDRQVLKIISDLAKHGVIEIQKRDSSGNKDIHWFRFPQSPKAADIVSIESETRETKAGKTAISLDWQPEEALLKELQKHFGIDSAEALGYRDRFVLYHTDRGERSFSWNSRFREWVLNRHQRQQDPGDRQIDGNWRPSQQIVDELGSEAVGASENFIENCIAEFICYWVDENPRAGNWNSKFLLHVKKQWRIMRQSVNETDPQPIAQNWQPSETVLGILTQMSGVSVDFIQNSVPEFVLYWSDRGAARHSWNSCFLNHVKRQWLRSRLPADSQLQQDFVDRHTNTDWRYGA